MAMSCMCILLYTCGKAVQALVVDFAMFLFLSSWLIDMNNKGCEDRLEYPL